MVNTASPDFHEVFDQIQSPKGLKLGSQKIRGKVLTGIKIN